MDNHTKIYLPFYCCRHRTISQFAIIIELHDNSFQKIQLNFACFNHSNKNIRTVLHHAIQTAYLVT